MFSCPRDVGIIAVARRQVSGQGNQLISLQSLVFAVVLFFAVTHYVWFSSCSWHYCKVMAAVWMLEYVMKQLQTAVPARQLWSSAAPLIISTCTKTHTAQCTILNADPTVCSLLPRSVVCRRHL